MLSLLILTAFLLFGTYTQKVRINQFIALSWDGMFRDRIEKKSIPDFIYKQEKNFNKESVTCIGKRVLSKNWISNFSQLVELFITCLMCLLVYII